MFSALRFCDKYLTTQKVKIFALIFSALHAPNVSDKFLAETAGRIKVRAG